MRILVIILAALLAPAGALAQTISGHVYDHHGDPLAGIAVAYSLAGNVQEDTTTADGAYLLSFNTSSVPEDPGPKVQGTTWGKLKAAFKDAPAAHGKAVAKSQTAIFPDTLYFLGGTNCWSNTHPLPAPSEPATVDMTLPPTVYTDIPAEGPIAINPTDNADMHNLLSAPVPPQNLTNARLWHPDRIQARIKVDIRPEWSQDEYDYIVVVLQWLEEHYDIRAAYGMESIFELVPRGSTTSLEPGVWRIKPGTAFYVQPIYETVNGELFIKHDEINLMYADSQHFKECAHEFTHGVDGSAAHVDWPGYNGDGISLMNGSAHTPVPPDKAYQKLAYQLQKLRLVDGKQDGQECNYFLTPSVPAARSCGP